MGFLPVIFALCQTQLAVHDELCGGLKVGVAVCDGFGVLRRELAQHPCGKVVVRVGLCADADADAGEVLPAQPGDDALQAVVPAGRTGGADAQLAGRLRDIIAQHQHMVGRDLEKARHGGDGIAGEVHVGQGLQQHHLVAVHLALSPQALKFGLANRDVPLGGQRVQRGKTGVVAGAVIFCFGVAQPCNEPDIGFIHDMIIPFPDNSVIQHLSITYARAKRYTL